MKRKGYSMFARTIAFIILLFSLISIPAGAVGTYFMASEGFYIAGAGEMKNRYLDDYFYELGKELLYRYYHYGEKSTTDKLKGTSIYYRITTSDDRVVGNVVDEMNTVWEWSRIYQYERKGSEYYDFPEMEEYSIEMLVPAVKVYPDYVALVCFLTNQASFLIILFPVMIVLGIILAIGSFSYLMCAAGWNRTKAEQTSGIFGWIPTDIFFILNVCIAVWMYESSRWSIVDYIGLARVCGLIVFLTMLCMNFLISISARSKAGRLWSYSVIGFGWKWIVKFLHMCKEAVCRLPIIWKSVVITVLLLVVELIPWYLVREEFVYSSSDEGIFSWLMLLWALEKLLVLPVIFYQLLKLKDLQLAGKKLAEGDINYKTDTALMFGEIKKHGEYLNRISEGVGKVVSERMKSEHLKTELITNVSHDIKTPLTSIINYADLICKVETDNEEIKEYSDVLYRQSTRLKKLIEDLVEASKASTGNIEVNLQPCDVGVLLEQAVGEFSQRLYEKNIDLVSKQPEEPVQISADPKLLWRVFDNLMTNICKYAQNGTRVYLSVEKLENKAVISFKNISEYPLDISADELMERFVRGDRSRHTEGNGLGLNIAKSLTELQDGTLELVIDGDLFKVLLSFTIL